MAKPCKFNGWLDGLLGPVPELPRPEGLDADRRAAVALWSSAALLVVMVFNGGFARPGNLWSGWSEVAPGSLADWLYWAVWRYVCFLGVPVAVVCLVFRESPARYGLRIHLTRRALFLYAALVLAALPFVYLASQSGDFRGTYPFVAAARGRGRVFWIWEAAYVLQFVCLEFFFRGYLLFSLEEKLGYLAVGVSVLPYGLLHINKPYPEALGAVVAGTVLGVVALRTRSILGGVLVHGTIAVALDWLVAGAA